MVAGTEDHGYMYNSEWEMPFFNMGSTFTHSDYADSKTEWPWVIYSTALRTDERWFAVTISLNR